MNAGAADIWKLLAPHAIAAGTLTPATAYAFRRLCELEARRRAFETQIDMDGLLVSVFQVDEETGVRYSVGEPRAHPLITHERQLQQRVEAGFARFMITGLGKSMLADKPPADPFDEFDEPPSLSLVKGA